MTPTCREVIDLLADYLESNLAPETVEGIDRHLAQCWECVAYVNTYQRTRDLTGQVARVEMPEAVRGRLRQLLLD
jgi:anti-sigma factor RsiW